MLVLNAAHIHLMTNHYAIFAAFFGAVLLAAGILRQQSMLRRAAYVIVISGAVMAAVAYLSGTMAEDGIERVAGVLESAVDPHEEAGLVTLVLLLLAGAVALYAMWHETRGKVRRVVEAAVLALTIAGFVAGGYAALLGGYIHHPEIRTPGGGGASQE